jgi:rod shape determining protein RodA
LIYRQCARLAIAFATMLVVAQIPPKVLRLWSPWLFGVGLLLLVLVLVGGDVGKGAQRWLDLGFMRFQPSEVMKLAVPMMAAWYLHDRPLPPRLLELAILALLVVLPVLLIAQQPDLGTALLVASSGVLVLLLGGLSLRLIFLLGAAAVGFAPVLWHFMHDYQRQRVLTFLNPESDPLGAGYHIIQSKIAIGSGGLFGKGWTNGTQAQLEFLPERSTDFIFAVLGEEFGLIGLVLLLCAYLFVIGRGLYIAVQAQDTFSRLLAGSIALTFFVYVFVNTGMVTGLLPVVGVPLPLISYGGTSMVTLMAGFGMLMSVHGHRNLLAR